MTLWLTRIVPAPASREARSDLNGSDQGIRLHQRMLQCFPMASTARHGLHSEFCSAPKRARMARALFCRVEQSPTPRASQTPTAQSKRVLSMPCCPPCTKGWLSTIAVLPAPCASREPPLERPLGSRRSWP